MTVIYQLARQHQAHGGATTVLVREGTRHDYPVGDCVEVATTNRNHFSRRAVLTDTVSGRIGLNRFYARRAYLPLAEAVPQHHSGPVFVHNAVAPLELFARKRPSASICLYAHNDLFRTYSRSEMARCLRPVTRIIGVSRFISEQITAKLGTRDDRVCVVGNGVDTDAFRPAAAPRADDEPVILFVGRVSPEKGPDLLLRAAVELHAAGRRFRVRIVGSQGFSATQPLSPYEHELRRLAEPLGDRVEFRPFVDRTQVLSEYQQASIFCAPSNWDEPSGLVIPEALACGLPTIASRRGGIPELGGDAVAYLDTPSVAELVELLDWLVTDRAARSELGRKARVRAEELSWSHRYDELIQVLGGDGH